MVLYLGYAALVLIGLYFTVGILKISGEGLAKSMLPIILMGEQWLKLNFQKIITKSW